MRIEFIAVTVAVLIVAGYFAYRSAAAGRRYGFREVVKNPALWRRMIRQSRDVEGDIAEAADWDDQQIACAVHHFVFTPRSERDAWREKRVLASFGARVHAPVLALLRDESLRPRLLKANSKDLLPEAPFNRACGLLEDQPPAAAIEVLAPFSALPDDNIRRDVGLVVGAIGKTEAVPLLRGTLGDADEYVRARALIGLDRARTNGRLDWRCKEELISDLKRLLTNNHNSRDAAKLLVDFDADSASAFFFSPEIFRPDSPALHACLEALADRGAMVSRDRLRALLHEVEQDALDYPRERIVAEGLRLLGHQRDSADTDYLQSHLSHAKESVARGAADGLIASMGLAGFQERLWERLRESGHDALTPPQRLYSAVRAADGDINNGGITQFFFNSSGDNWPDAMSGYQAIGCLERATILREAVAKFGPNGPPTDRDLRQDALSRLARKDDAFFDALSTRYYECRESVDVALARHVIANADAFR